MPSNTSTDTVVIGCKLPHGLQLRIPNAAPVIIKGANSSEIIGGHGLTEGVSKDFWEQWKKLHRDFKPLKLGLIFAQGSEADARAEAKERAGERTGFERLDPANPAPGVVPENYEGMPEQPQE